MSTVRHALGRDLDDLAMILARAFHDDPVWSWVLPDQATRAVGLVRVMRVALEAGLRRGHVYHLPAAAAIWSPPDVPMFTPEEGAAFGAALADLVGSRLEPVLSGLQSISARHPHDQPHFYLFMIGTEPLRQRHGHGGKLLRHVLDRCDEQDLPAYLESSNPVNVPFYEHHGFRVRDRVGLPDGPTLDLMWRDPR